MPGALGGVRRWISRWGGRLSGAVGGRRGPFRRRKGRWGRAGRGIRRHPSGAAVIRRHPPSAVPRAYAPGLLSAAVRKAVQAASLLRSSASCMTA